MLGHKSDEEIQTFVLNFLIAGVTSSIAKTVAAPIDRIKLILQSQNSALHVLTGERKKFGGLVDCFKRLPKEQGFLSFWRGNGINLLRYIPTQALNFSFNDFFKLHLSTIIRNDPSLISYFSGACAGATTALFVYPLKFCQTRLSLDMGSGRRRIKKGKDNIDREFQGLTDCFRKVTKVDGVIGVYRGFILAIIGAMTYRSLYFGLFDHFKHLYNNYYTPSHHEVAQKPSIMTEFLLAQSVTTIAGMLTYPLDTVGRRLMLDAGRTKQMKIFTGACNAFKVMYVHEGVNAFYKGAFTNCLRGIGGALVLVLYDEVLYYTNWKEFISYKKNSQ